MRAKRGEDFGAGAQPFGVRGEANWNDHELLEVGGVRRVLPAIQDVEERNGERLRGFAANLFVQLNSMQRSARMCCGEGDTKERICTKPTLIRRAIECNQLRIKRALVINALPSESARDLVVDCGNGLKDALPTEAALVAIATLDRFMSTSACARWDGGGAVRTTLKVQLNLYGWIAA